MTTRLVCRHSIIALALLCFASLAIPAELQSGANVYLLSMRSGFNLFLANQLTQSSVLTVVTDPAMAEYILTDSVGEAFEQSMEALYPKPKPEEAKPEHAETPKEETKKESGGMGSMVDAYSTTVRRPSAFSRADGTYFLVDRHNRVVVWSTFLNHRDTRNEAMNKDAARVVKRLKEFMKASVSVPAMVP
ncbi:MAG: hypothetical protein U5J83_11455 [Bryobacterales bacterium]|nr:hypothetical protein [Bryobacterales bacterium]